MKCSVGSFLLLLATLMGIVWCVQIDRAALASTAGIRDASYARQHTVVTITALQPWQSTGLTVKQGDTVSITVIAGEWTAWAGHSPYNAGEGESSSAPDGFPLPGYPSGSLIGQIARDGHFFEVGHQSTFTAQDSGLLYLQINDEGLSDNDGALTISITASPSVPAGVLVLYPTGNAGIPPNSPVRFAWQSFPGARHYAIQIWLVKQMGSRSITPRTPLVFSTLVFNKTAYTWNDKSYLPGMYQYSLLPFDAYGNALAPWSTPVQINIYNT